MYVEGSDGKVQPLSNTCLAMRLLYQSVPLPQVCFTCILISLLSGSAVDTHQSPHWYAAILTAERLPYLCITPWMGLYMKTETNCHTLHFFNIKAFGDSCDSVLVWWRSPDDLQWLKYFYSICHWQVFIKCHCNFIILSSIHYRLSVWPASVFANWA